MAMREDPTEVRPVGIDWWEYFRKFSSAHGGDPVEWRVNRETNEGGFLLFRDGWMYSRVDPAGPEYPPPEDDRDFARLVRVYWATRKRIFEVEVERTKAELLDAVEIQSRYSQPLQIEYEGTEGESPVSSPIDFEILLSRYRSVLVSLREAEEMLRRRGTPPRTSVTPFRSGGIIARIEALEHLDDEPRHIGRTA